MAVQANTQLIQMDPASTNCTGAVRTNTTLPASFHTVGPNGLIHAILPTSSAPMDATKQLQLRVVQTSQASNSNKSNQVQPQVVRLIKTNKTPTAIANANIISVKAPTISSPSKGLHPTLVLPTARVLHPGGTKLKVGDTITIPKSSLLTEKGTPHSSSGMSQTEVLSTPPKIIRVADAATAQNPVFISRATPGHNPVTVVHATSTEANTSFSHQAASPARLAAISSDWTQSPLRYKRPSAFNDTTQGSETKRRRTPNSEKGSKGLRHFAMLVCEKVKQKGTTTYNEVADELVAEYSDSHPNSLSDQQYDQKNIRRRVYDALNVLMAMNIIFKDKKDINWIGFPTNSAQELLSLQNEKKKKEMRIEQKTQQLHELILQQIAFKNLVERNKRIQETQGSPPENSFIQLPFIIVNTSKKTVIDCSISNDKYEYMFNFDNTFEIHDDIEVLKRMGMAFGLESGSCSSDDLRAAQALLPPALKPYLEEMAGFGRPRSTGGNLVSNYTLQNPRSSSAAHVSSSSTGGKDAESLELESCFSMEQVLDPDDEEVAMVTDNSRMGRRSSSGAAAGVAMSSRSSSSGLNSAMYSITPMSSGGSESRGSTPFDSFET